MNLASCSSDTCFSRTATLVISYVLIVSFGHYSKLSFFGLETDLDMFSFFHLRSQHFLDTCSFFIATLFVSPVSVLTAPQVSNNKKPLHESQDRNLTRVFPNRKLSRKSVSIPHTA